MRKEDAMGDGLREILRDNGLKQSALASYLGLAKSTVCGICAEKCPKKVIVLPAGKRKEEG